MRDRLGRVAVAALLMAACSGSSADATVTLARDGGVSAGSLTGPVGEGAVVLSVVSRMGTVDLDVAAIEQLDLWTVEMVEPFVDEEVSVTAVKVQDLFDAVGLAVGATTTLTALDDYVVTFEGAQWVEDAWLVTAQSGNPVPIDAGGPIRLVFTGGAFVADLDRWIWSLRTMEVG